MQIGRLRRPLGFALIGLSGCQAVAFIIIPFLVLSWEMIATRMGLLFVTGEICFAIGILLLGKDVIKWLKSTIAKLKED